MNRLRETAPPLEEVEVWPMNQTSVDAFTRCTVPRRDIVTQAGAVAIYDPIPRAEIEAVLRAMRIPPDDQLRVFDDVVLMETEARRILNERDD